MKRRLLLIAVAAVFIWGISRLFNRNDPDLKNVGDVAIIYDNMSYKLKGQKVSKCYMDDITEFGDPDLRSLASDLVVLNKPEDDPEASEDKKDDPEQISLKYKGDFVYEVPEDIEYSVFDSNCNLLYTSEVLSLNYDEGKQYIISVDVKWGKRKNYTLMRYFFKVST